MFAVVAREFVGTGEFPPASLPRTLVRFLARVRPDVLGVVLPGEEVLAAELAHVRLDLETINQKLFLNCSSLLTVGIQLANL